MERGNRGQVLPIVMVCMMLLVILITGLVNWNQSNTTLSVKNQKTITAVNLAEAGIDRAMWFVQSSTYTWAKAMAGTVQAGYNLDQTYSDISGGFYRVKLTSGPASTQVTIHAEGKDLASQEVRSLECVVQDARIPGALFSGGNITYSDNFQVHWGAIASQGNIIVTYPDKAGKSPRKLSRQVVTGVGGGVSARDTNGLTPPNTNNVEWWSKYPVPAMPALDFTTMRASAAANGTLNRCTSAGSGNCNFNNSASTTNATSNLIWYWDSSITSSPCSAASPCTTVKVTGNIGMRGTLIFRGNVQTNGSDNMAYTTNIPSEAWKEYQWCDTAASNEYPGDIGYHVNSSTFNLGSQTWGTGACFDAGDTPAAPNTDVAFRGFVYVGGNLDLLGVPDFNGALWVVGTVTRTGSGYALVFFDNALQNIPVLNVVLSRVSWKDVTPSNTSWP